MEDQLICTGCGSVGKTKKQPKGHLLLEIILWFFWIIPGLIYTLWRQTTYRQVCTVCGSDALIPTSSPNGKHLLEQMGKGVKNSDTKELPLTEQVKNAFLSSYKAVLGIIATLLFFAWLLPFLAERGMSDQTQNVPQPRQTVQKSVTTTTTPNVTKNINYDVIEEWSIPNGGKGQSIVISPTNVNEPDMIALGTKIKNDMASERNAFVFVFSDKQAAMLRSKVFADEATAAENSLYDSNFVGNYKKNATTGYHMFVISLEGVNGTSKEITY